MADSPEKEEQKVAKYVASKDKKCPYCEGLFTSSSLGRHLDLFIRDRNPKPPDGIHDVEDIRQTRGNVTRRQPRHSLGGHRDSITPTGTPRLGSRKPSLATLSRQSSSGSLPKEGRYAVDSTVGKNPFPAPRWESTGVMNDIGEQAAASGNKKRPGMSRAVSRQAAQKAQLDSKNKLTDAMDTARAAELALRELLSSWRAAKQQFNANSKPFEFDPLSLDFPALTLQCLHPPPTLFSSTQHPTATSWSIQPPGQSQFHALQSYFLDKFRFWKVACITATVDAFDDIPCAGEPQQDRGEIVRKAERSAENLERQVDEHLRSAYAVWDRLPPQRQSELWVLELARSVGRKQQEVDARKETQEKLEQEIVNLKSSIDHLNRLQQPREFKIVTPTTFPFDKDFITHAYELCLKGASATGFNVQDRDADLGTVVTRAVERWKNVIVSSRITNGGMAAQKPLNQPNGASNGRSSSSSVNGVSTPQPRSQAQTPQQICQSEQSLKRTSTASTNGAMTERTASTTNTTAPPSVDEASDQDADADMEDDDSFAMMNHSPTKQSAPAPLQQPPSQPSQQRPRLEIPRTRPSIQQQTPQSLANQGYVLQSAGNSPVRSAAINMSRSMPNMAMAMQNNAMHAADMGMTMHGLQSEQMYLE